MAKHLSALRNFRVTDLGAYGDGAPELEHVYRECDWHEYIDGLTLPQVMRLANRHAGGCDGTATAKPEPGGQFINRHIPEIWSAELLHTLERGLTYDRPPVSVLPDLPGGGR